MAVPEADRPTPWVLKLPLELIVILLDFRYGPLARLVMLGKAVQSLADILPSFRYEKLIRWFVLLKPTLEILYRLFTRLFEGRELKPIVVLLNFVQGPLARLLMLIKGPRGYNGYKTSFAHSVV